MKKKENNDSNENKYVDNIGSRIDSIKLKEYFRRHKEDFFMNDNDILIPNENKTKGSVYQHNKDINNIFNNIEKDKILVKKEFPSFDKIINIFKSLIGLNNLGLTYYMNSSL